jgi:hypothetical protein
VDVQVQQVQQVGGWVDVQVQQVGGHTKGGDKLSSPVRSPAFAQQYMLVG